MQPTIEVRRYFRSSKVISGGFAVARQESHHRPEALVAVDVSAEQEGAREQDWSLSIERYIIIPRRNVTF